jgi:hypothetical protein
VGAWAPAAWGRCFADAGVKSEFQAVLTEWAEQSSNMVLKTAAQGVLSLTRA